MAFSSIRRKKCKCSEFCDKWPTMGWGGYFMSHAPQELRDKQTKKEVERRNKAKRSQISRNLHKQVDIKENILSANGGAVIHPQSQQWAWFVERRKEMQNICCECGRGTQRGNDKYFHWQIAHIVPKGLVPSVATHEYNWIELCWLHHQTFDSTFDKAAQMMCFSEVYLKFQLFKHLIPPHELRKINPHLLK